VDTRRSEDDADGWATKHVPRWLDKVCTGGCSVLERHLKGAGLDPREWFREKVRERERYLEQLQRSELLVSGTAPEEDPPIRSLLQTIDELNALLT
jgi:hypothetical protein